MPSDDYNPNPPLLPTTTTLVPVIEESIRLDKEVVETGRVVIRKMVHHDTQTVSVPTQEE